MKSLSRLTLIAFAATVALSLNVEAQTQAENLRRQGEQAFAQRDFLRAVDLLTRSVEMTTSGNSRASIYNMLGEAYYELERYVEAKEALEAALDLRPNFQRAKSNLEIVKWNLPGPTLDERIGQRFSTKKTIAGQVFGSYFTGAAIGGWFVFGGGLLGYKELDGQITLLAAGLVFGSVLRVPEVAEMVSFGHGATRNAVAGALLPPLVAVFIEDLTNSDATSTDRIHAARIGAIFSPLVATLGYNLSTTNVFGRSGIGRAETPSLQTPFEAGEPEFVATLARVSF